MNRFCFFSAKNWSYLEFQCILKKVKTKRKIIRQSCSKHLYRFSRFSTIFLHHKWNGTRFYHQKVNVWTASQVVERLKTYYIRKVGNYKKIPDKLRFDGTYSANHLKAKFWQATVKHFKEKSILLSFVKLSITLCSIL